jgi:hypothetical protein
MDNSANLDQVGKLYAKNAVANIANIAAGGSASFTCNLRNLSGFGTLTMARAKILVLASYSRSVGIIRWTATSRSRPFVCGNLPSGEGCVDEEIVTTEPDPLVAGTWQTFRIRAMCGEHADHVCANNE